MTQPPGHRAPGRLSVERDSDPIASIAGHDPVPVRISQPKSVLDRSHRRPSRWNQLLKAAAPRWGADGLAAELSKAPPWLFSMLVHIVLLLVFGLWLLPDVSDRVVSLSAVFADARGQQLAEEPIELGVDQQDEQQVVTPPELPPVVQPLVAPPPSPEIVEHGSVQISDATAPDVGAALNGRTPGMKRALLAEYGGTEITEAAVRDGLEWLRRHQRRDGSWALNGPYADGAATENPTAATAMALIAFQGAGHTHVSGRHQVVVKRGARALVRMQDADGDFFRGNIQNHRLYSQAQAMIAICELYGMTQDPTLRVAAERSVAYAVRTQDRLGGWRYQPGFDSDTSVTGWFMMGLQSARMAGLDVPSETLQRLSEYLDSAATARGARYGYQPGMESTDTMTAEALLCRQYLGWPKNDRRMKIGINLILARPIDWEDRNVYYWYYATQVLHHVGEQQWHEWNRVMRDVLPAHQTKQGSERGSWFPTGDRWGPHGGRLYVTCMSLFMLEVYYRHLPIYSDSGVPAE